MRVPFDAALSAPTTSWASVLRDFAELTKPRLSSLVLFTTAGAMWLSGRSLSWPVWVLTLLGTAGTVGAANAFNSFLERESDGHMVRTANRPLPAGRLSPLPALAFAVALAVVSLPLLAAVSWLVFALGLLALLTYVAVYTPLKVRSHWAMMVGAVPGALPPLMGWAAATGRIDGAGLSLFGILYLWQLPHFLAIALFRKADYRRAGLASLPLERGDQAARRFAVLCLALLFPVSLLPWALGLAGSLYLAVALALGLVFLAQGVNGWRRRGDERWARRLFRTSLVYLTGLFAALAVNGLPVR